MVLQEVELKKWTSEEHNVIVDGEVVKLNNVQVLAQGDSEILKYYGARK